MKLKKYTEFLNENMNVDLFLGIFIYFNKILKIHEEYYYHDTKISINPEFKKELNNFFIDLQEENKVFAVDIYNLVGDYENKLYNNMQISHENINNSFWKICDNLFSFSKITIEDFGERNIYSIQDSLESKIDEYEYKNDPYDIDDEYIDLNFDENNYIDEYDQLFEVEGSDIPIDFLKATNIIEKDPEKIEKEYEKMLGRKGLLSTYYRKKDKVFTFGVLKGIFEDALAYKKKRELMKGGYKMLHRAVPIALAFLFFPAWIVTNVLGTSRAFNKVVIPLVKNPETKYSKFLTKFINTTIAITEGEIKYLMPKDWYYNLFVMEDDLLKIVRKDVLRIFAIELANKMEQESNDNPVPHHYVENQLKTFLNDKFAISPPMGLKTKKSTKSPKYNVNKWYKKDMKTLKKKTKE